MVGLQQSTDAVFLLIGVAVGRHRVDLSFLLLGSMDNGKRDIFVDMICAALNVF